MYRRQDDPDKMDRNADAFAACHAAFDAGRVVAIYPEGTTHSEARVQRIKTGAARIALAYEAQRPRALSLVPVGLTFEARKSFRGRVLVSFGPAIAVSPHADAYRDDPAKAVDALTTAIQWGMEGQVVHVDRIDAAALVQAVEQLYRDELVRELREERGLSEREVDVLRLSRSIVDAADYFRTREPARLERIWQHIQGYRGLLAEYRVRDDAVRARSSAPACRGGSSRAGKPSSASRVRLWLPRERAALLRAALAGASHRRKETDYATTRFLASIVAYPVFWGLEIWLVGRVFGVSWVLPFAPDAAAQRPPRLPVPGRRGPPPQSAPPRRARPAPRRRSQAAGSRAPGVDGRAGAREGRLPRRHEGAASEPLDERQRT